MCHIIIQHHIIISTFSLVLKRYFRQSQTLLTILSTFFNLLEQYKHLRSAQDLSLMVVDFTIVERICYLSQLMIEMMVSLGGIERCIMSAKMKKNILWKMSKYQFRVIHGYQTVTYHLMSLLNSFIFGLKGLQTLNYSTNLK